MAEFGWLGVLVPSSTAAWGWTGEMAIVAGGLARALVPEPLTAAAVLAARAIVHGDNEDLKQLLLPKVVAGS